jgi:hypothetical protein
LTDNLKSVVVGEVIPNLGSDFMTPSDTQEAIDPRSAFILMNELLSEVGTLLRVGDEWQTVRQQHGYVDRADSLEALREEAERRQVKIATLISEFTAAYRPVGERVRYLSGGALTFSVKGFPSSDCILDPVVGFAEDVSLNWNFPDRDFGYAQLLAAVASRQAYEMQLLSCNAALATPQKVKTKKVKTKRASGSTTADSESDKQGGTDDRDRLCQNYLESHHQPSPGARNRTPAKVTAIAKATGQSKSTVSRYFKDHWGGHKRYRAICARREDEEAIELKLQNMVHGQLRERTVGDNLDLGEIKELSVEPRLPEF